MSDWFREKLVESARDIKNMCLGYGGMVNDCHGCPFLVDNECALKSAIPALWKTGKIKLGGA